MSEGVREGGREGGREREGEGGEGVASRGVLVQTMRPSHT